MRQAIAPGMVLNLHGRILAADVARKQRELFMGSTSGTKLRRNEKTSARRRWSEYLESLLTNRSGVAGKGVVVRKPTIDGDRGRTIEPGKEGKFLQVISETVGAL